MARVIWRELEHLHAVTYFSPECRAAYVQLDLRGFWMGYFAGRAAPMGSVAPGVVEATFFNFHPSMVRRAIPDAWTHASPEAVVAARSGAAATAIRRVAPGAYDLGRELLPILERAVERGNGAGRPLFAANRDAVPPSDVLARVWQAATALREHRGDGHVAVLTEAGLDGCEAHVLYVATTGVDPELLRANRGWSTDEWSAAIDRLRDRGLVSVEGPATGAGRDLRDGIERRTDELALQPFASLTGGDVDELLRIARLIAAPIAASGEIPYPNPMGLPRSSSS